MLDKEKIEKLQTELDKVYEELYELKSVKSKKYLFDAHHQLINEIETGINTKIEEYKEQEFDMMPVEDFLSTLKLFKRYIQEYKRSYKL
jgi:hypothetical protein